MHFNVRILALGSHHGDDRAGWQVAGKLALDPRIAPYVHLLNSPWDFIDHALSDRSLIVIDACRGAGIPGSVVICGEPELATVLSRSRSTHGGSLQEAVALARQLGQSFRELVIVAVEVESCEPQTPLSQSVSKGIEEAAEAVRRQLDRWNRDRTRQSNG